MACNHRRPGDHAPLRHPIKHLPRHGDVTTRAIPRDQSVPRNDVLRDHFIEQASCIVGPAELKVHVDERVADEEVGFEAARQDEGVGHLPVRPGKEASAGLEDGGEREFVGQGGAGGEEATEMAEGNGVEVVEGKGPEEGVPGDEVGGGESRENEGGMAGVGARGSGADELDSDDVGVYGVRGRRGGDEVGVELE